MKKLALFIATAAAAAALVACGGGDPTYRAATVDAQAAMTASTAGTVQSKAFTFGSGVAELGTAGTSTTVTFGGGGSTFSIGSGGETASGTAAYGSCDFTVTTSDFVAPHPLAVKVPAAPIIIPNCVLSVDTSGLPANGTGQTTTTTLTLGATVSNPVPITVVINGDTGVVSIGGVVVGTVTVANVTGTSGSF